MYCSKCGVANDSGSFCTSCGSALTSTQPTQPAQPQWPAPQPWATPQQPQLSQPNWQAPLTPVSAGSGFSTAAIVLGVISFLVFPILFGPAGIICGAIAKSKNERNADKGLLIAILGTVIGFMLGVMFWSY